MSADDNFDSHWMIFDITAQHWTFFMNDLNFGTSCCYGNMLTLRNVHYYFHNGVPGSNVHYYFHNGVLGSSETRPIYKILDNGTSIDLGISKSQFNEEYLAAVARANSDEGNVDIGFLSIVQAPFYQRFYGDVPT